VSGDDAQLASRADEADQQSKVEDLYVQMKDRAGAVSRIASGEKQSRGSKTRSRSKSVRVR
jgi:hypothetical protein